MIHLIVLAKIAAIMAAIGVLPFVLVFQFGVPVVWAVPGSLALACLLTSLWTVRRTP